jgi:outer membrane protein insertion porin family
MYKIINSTLSSFLLTFVIVAALCVTMLSNAETSSGNIDSIAITGNHRTEKSTILSYTPFKKGKGYSKKESDEAINDLYNTGFFSKININFNNGKLLISVIENPIINKVDFKGNKALKTDKLSQELSSKSRAFFSKSKLNSDINRVFDLYNKSGRFSTKIRPQIATLPQNRVNILFNIEEGKKSVIKKIIFIGNKKFSDGRLKSALMSKEDKIYNMFRANYYDADIVDYDKVLLTKFYHSEGYANFKVISATADIAQDRNGFLLTYSVEEGDVYKFGNISIRNKVKNIKNKTLLEKITSKNGDVFNSKLVDNSTETITKYLAVNGYPFVDVTAKYNIDQKNKTVNIEYVTSEAKKVYIGRINIKGNLKTYDSVIRREVKLSEGDPYNSFLITNSEKRLQNLDFFEKVTIETKKSKNNDTVDLDVSIEEKSTASINISAGYSTSDGPLAMLGFTEKNLFGQGKRLNLQLQKSPSSSNIGFGLTQPNFLQSSIDAGFSMKYSTQDNKTSALGAQSNTIPYNSDHKSASTFISYEITEGLGHNVTYSIASNTIKNVDTSSALIFQEQTGKNTVSAIGHNLFYDKTDSSTNPTKGYAINFGQVLAGLGGDSKYIKHSLEASYYAPITKDIILKLSASAGNIKGLGKAVRLDENFQLGEYSLRGFDSSGIGPRHKAFSGIGPPPLANTEGALGGTSFYTGTIEAKFPIPGLPKDSDVFGSAFSDFGTLWGVDIPNNSAYTKSSFHNDRSIRASAGFGIIWITNMGPLRIDYAKALKKQKYDKTRTLLFSFSTLF